MIDYLIDAKFIFDSLAIVGFPILDVDFVEYVINGLGPKYQSFIISFLFHPSITFDELYDFLLRKGHFHKNIFKYVLSKCCYGYGSIILKIFWFL